MNILILGASGNIGSLLIEKLCKKDYEIVAFIRENSSIVHLKKYEIRIIKGDLEKSETIIPALEGIDIVINTSYIVFAKNILKAIEDSKSKIKRVIYIGSTGIYTKLPSKSANDKRTAEEIIKKSSIPYTILRPTMIYGTGKDRNIFRLISFLHRYPVFPIFGNGENLLQPVYIEDVVQSIISSLNTSNALNKIYDIGGKNALTYNQLIDTTARYINKRIIRIHLPVMLSLQIARIIKRIIGKFPISEEQILRLNEDKTVDISDAVKDFGYTPISFEEGIEREVKLFFKRKDVES